MIQHIHWLYGSQKPIKFKVPIRTETQCGRCIHRKVCPKNTEDRCANFLFGTSAEPKGCMRCTHRFTRYDDKQPIPCFRCHDFKTQRYELVAIGEAMTTNAERSVAADIKRTQKAMKKALTLTPALASKIASCVVHADEMLSAHGHPFDKQALQGALTDPEVMAWIKALGVLAPVKRR